MTLGPYSFINTVAGGNRKITKPEIVLRYAMHRRWDDPDFRKTDTNLYHAGSPPEELAALASMLLGIRLRAGRSIRRFEPLGDPLGRPEEIGDQPEPNFAIPHSYIIPRAAKGQHPMQPLALLQSLTTLPAPTVNAINRGLRVTVDLQGNGSDVVAYQAKKGSPPINLDKIGHYDIDEFWIPIRRNEKLQCILEPGEFYILASKQRVRIPPDLAAEMLPYDLATQEFRVHYAGFFDPGFGYGANGEISGTRAVLEVRASQMPILLEDDQFVGRLNYFNMAAKPDKVYGGKIGSSYQGQGLALSKQFKRPAESRGLELKTPGSSPTDADDDESDPAPGPAFSERRPQSVVSVKNR